MNNKLLFVATIILTSISTGYSLETTKTIISGNPLNESTQNLDASIVTEIMADNEKYKSHIVTTEKHSFNIEYKGPESLLNEMSRLFNLKSEENH